MHADQLLSYRFDQQRGDDGRVYAAGQCQQHFFIANLFLQRRNLFVNKRFRKFRSRNAFHRFRAFCLFHREPPCSG